jgi:hypothetical protein
MSTHFPDETALRWLGIGVPVPAPSLGWCYWPIPRVESVSSRERHISKFVLEETIFLSGDFLEI